VNERGNMMKTNIKKHGMSCTFLFFIIISHFILSPCWLFSKEADAASIQSVIPAPTGQQTFSHPLTASPAFISSPALAQPIAVGPFSEGGDTLNIQVGLNQFTEAVNMYGAYTVSTNPTTIYVLDSDLSFRAYSIDTIAQALVSGTLPFGVEPLRENITSLFYETFFTMPITDIAPGIYNLYLLLTPADSIQTYYLWKTTLENTGHQLSIDKVGSGTVTSSDGLINCGTDCSELYNDDTLVTLSASPADGYSFDRWTGCDSTWGSSCFVTMTSSRSVTAIFIVNTQAYTLTVNKNGTGTGTVTSSPPGINCGSNCISLYAEGTPVSLTATPASGSIFQEWTGCDNVFSNTCQITMSSNRSVTSTFTFEGGGGGEINYIPIHLTLSGATYSGAIHVRDVPIGPNPAQEFYSVTRPAACTTMMQIATSGYNIANQNMVISNSDFGTAGEALTRYQDFLNTTGYEINTEVVIGGTTYWYWFAASFESEYVNIFNPSDSTYYIEVVNESNFDGFYRIEAHCL
jgi:hypothetical protein